MALIQIRSCGGWLLWGGARNIFINSYLRLLGGSNRSVNSVTRFTQTNTILIRIVVYINSPTVIQIFPSFANTQNTQDIIYSNIIWWSLLLLLLQLWLLLLFQLNNNSGSSYNKGKDGVSHIQLARGDQTPKTHGATSLLFNSKG